MSVRSPSIAAALSFLLPGLGQLGLGWPGRAAVVALPAVTVALGAAAIALAAGDTIGDLLLEPATLTVLLVLNAGLGVYHAAAIIDAWRLAVRAATPRRAGRGAVVALAGVLAMTVGAHGWIEYVGFDANATLDMVFRPGGAATDDGDGAGEDAGGLIPEPSFSDELEEDWADAGDGGAGEGDASDEPDEGPWDDPGESVGPADPTPPAGTPGATAAATATVVASVTPAPTPTSKPTPKPTPVPAWALDGRLNLLLVGADSGPDRWSLRTDTMILLSVATRTGRAALFGIPRNLVGVPLAPESAGAFRDGRFPQLLNALYVHAMAHPEQFPGGENRGYRAVAGAVQELVGERLDGMIVVNLAGFVTLVNEMGGLWIDIPERLYDRNYPLEDGTGHMTVEFLPGCQHLDGRMALAYARSRHQDSDYGRMGRQQEVLVALKRQVNPIALIPRIPALLRIARDNLWTTLRRKEIASMARLAAKVNTRRIRMVTFVPPRYPAHLDDDALARIRSAVRNGIRGPLPPLLPQPESKRCR